MLRVLALADGDAGGVVVVQKLHRLVLLRRERAEVVREAVSELPEAFKVVVVMREWDDLSYEEISQRLDLSVGTVKSRLFRARAMLLKKLKGWDENEG